MVETIFICGICNKEVIKLNIDCKCDNDCNCDNQCKCDIDCNYDNQYNSDDDCDCDIDCNCNNESKYDNKSKSNKLPNKQESKILMLLIKVSLYINIIQIPILVYLIVKK